jgi:glycosyltransferase involved in cell wall biosynthesis
MDNAVVLDTSDPQEAAWYMSYLKEHPAVHQRLRDTARDTAGRFSWDRVLEQLLARVQVLAAVEHMAS